MKKAIIFDSGTLISFSMNGLLNEIRNLKKIFNGHFLISQEVKKEIIDKPLKIKKFELEALKIKQLLDEKILEFPENIGLNKKEINIKAKEILNSANSIFIDKENNKEIKIIDLGESSCLAISEMLEKRNIKNIIAIDERTTRSLCESSKSLHQYLEKKFHTKLKINKNLLNQFKKYRFLRSAELIYVAYKKGVISIKGNKVLDALLWAMKFKGCAISKQEIEDIKKLG